MSTQTEITRLQTARNTIRTKLVDLGLATAASKLDALATAVDGIDNQGAVSASVQEGESYTIPKGYHNGAGTVKGVAGGGNYSLQAKSITPTKKQQSVTPDAGYYGLSGVTVNAIPDNYNDTSNVTAAASDVLANKVIVNADGETVAGTMPNNAHGGGTLDISNTSYTIAKGYYSGMGTVNIVPEAKAAIPSKSEQVIAPTTGKVLSSVTVRAIPDAYQDVSGVDATADDVLDGKVIVDAEGNEITGTIPVIGATGTVLDTTLGNQSKTIAKGYHSGTGTVKINLEEKSVTPTTAAQTVTPTTGKVLSKVSVAAIPSAYIITTDATAAAANILAGKTAYVAGAKVTGTMANNGSTSATMDGLVTTSVTIPAGYTTGGTVSLTNAIETALAAI